MKYIKIMFNPLIYLVKSNIALNYEFMIWYIIKQHKP